jgi:hypothetical protein
VFRRRSTATPDAPAEGTPDASAAEQGRASLTAGKGRPTPKRSEAERARRYKAPGDRKEALRQSKTRDRSTRARKAEAMRRGEEWALPAKDKGPVRALARDYVDSRRRLSEYYMYGLGVLVVLLFLPSTRLFVDYLVLVVVVIMLAEGSFIGRQIVKLAKERFPGEPTRGVKLYAGLRAMQIRRLRMPAPRVTPGGTY